MIGGDAVVLAAALSLLLPLEGVAGLIVVTLVWALLTRLQRGANDAPTIDRAPRLRITPFFLALTLLVVAVALVTKLRSS